MFTIIQECRRQGYEPTPRVAWELGAAVRDGYVIVYGSPPIKALRGKTHGTGSHCFALYPDEFRPIAAEIIRALLVADRAAALAQPSLFE
jgi:hypothetical protein